MERKINRKIEEEFSNYKQTIKKGIVETIASINTQVNTFQFNLSQSSIDGLKEEINKEMMSLLQELYDYPLLQLTKTDFQKRKRVKNVVPLHDRCTALRANGEQCTRRKKDSLHFCGTHSKGTPHGITCQTCENQELPIQSKKISVWAQDIKGIIYYIDDKSNVYETSSIIKGINNPKVIAKYEKNLDSEGNVYYQIPEFNI